MAAAERVVRRCVARWEPTTSVAVRPALPLFPKHTVVVTGTPELLDGLGTADGDPLVLSTRPTQGRRRRYLAELSEAAVRAALDQAVGDGTIDRVAHVRIVTSLGGALPAGTALDAGGAELFRLQDAAFLVLRAAEPTLRQERGTVLALFTDAFTAAVAHPYLGLFSGFLQSVAMELDGCVVRTVFTDADRLAPALRELSAETATAALMPVAAYRGGVRHTIAVDEQPAVPTGEPALSESSVVVAVGGARGITAEALTALARRYRCRIYALGSTPLDAVLAQSRAFGGPDALIPRPQYISTVRATRPELPVRAVIDSYQRLADAAEAHRNLTAMRRHSGPANVTYLQADVLDQERLDAAIDRVYAAEGRVDLLVHAAGINRAGSITTKSFADFTRVRTVKVQGYLNLRRALRGRRPARWCNFGSLTGMTGQLGETDYAAANGFLSTAAGWNCAAGADEFTIGWTMWKDAGMASSSIHRSYFTSGLRGAILSQMGSREGRRLFVEELQAANPSPATSHLGRTERAAIEAIYPGFFEPRTPPPPAAQSPVAPPPVAPPAAGPPAADRPAGRFFIDRTTADGPGRLVAYRQFSLDRDGYLAGHLVDDTPTLPGTFVAELAAEAARQLVPDLTVTGLRDISFEHFLRLGGATDRAPHRFECRLRCREADRAVVDVVVLADVVAPGGAVLRRGKVNFRATVVLQADYPPAPRWQPWPAAPERPVPDPYHAPGSSIQLTGPFVTTRQLRLHPFGKRASYAPSLPSGGVFGAFLLPVLLLDGLARLSVVDLVGDRHVPVAAPTGIRRIDFYGPANDVALAGRGGIELYSTPRTTTITRADTHNHFVAAGADGAVLLEMADAKGVVLAAYDIEERKFVSAHVLAHSRSLIDVVPI